jgi:hypothetical protein
MDANELQLANARCESLMRNCIALNTSLVECYRLCQSGEERRADELACDAIEDFEYLNEAGYILRDREKNAFVTARLEIGKACGRVRGARIGRRVAASVHECFALRISDWLGLVNTQAFRLDGKAVRVIDYNRFPGVTAAFLKNPESVMASMRLELCQAVKLFTNPPQPPTEVSIASLMLPSPDSGAVSNEQPTDDLDRLPPDAVPATTLADAAGITEKNVRESFRKKLERGRKAGVLAGDCEDHQRGNRQCEYWYKPSEEVKSIARAWAKKQKKPADISGQNVQHKKRRK